MRNCENIETCSLLKTKREVIILEPLPHPVLQPAGPLSPVEVEEETLVRDVTEELTVGQADHAVVILTDWSVQREPIVPDTSDRSRVYQHYLNFYSYSYGEVSS